MISSWISKAFKLTAQQRKTYHLNQNPQSHRFRQQRRRRWSSGTRSMYRHDYLLPSQFSILPH
ncbi:hypothetical protein Hdeb2414_s0033g00718611 [Helianthus debilis subsp. tardiflorus]